MLKSILVLPFGAVHPQQGGGQRTAILYEALAGLGPVVIVQLCESPPPSPGPGVFFPECQSFHVIAAQGYGGPSRPALVRALSAIVRFAFPWRQFRCQPSAKASFEEIRRRFDPDLMVFRYARPFATLGLPGGGSATTPIAVDVDDREDLRLLSYLQGVLPLPFFYDLYRRYLSSTFRPRSSSGLGMS